MSASTVLQSFLSSSAKWIFLSLFALTLWGGGLSVLEVSDFSSGVAVSEVQVGFGGELVLADLDSKSNTSTTGLSVINALFNILFALLTPLLMFAGWLLTPDWVFGEIFGLRPVLHDLWVLVSNIVYIIFAFLLVAMAFMNIFGYDKDKWAIKAKLPKLIIGIISVPFTWFFVSAVVSIASVLTASVVQLAGDLKPAGGAELTFPIYEKCKVDFTASPNSQSGTGSKGKFLDCENKKDTNLSEILKSDSAYGIVSYYAFGVFKIQDYKTISDAQIPSFKSVLDLSVQLIIALVMFVIFFLIIVALVFALFTRALYFWVIAVFSPLLSLKYFFDGKIGVGEDFIGVDKIIGLAMVPVYVAAALSFGLIFASAVTSANLGDKAQSGRYVQVGPATGETSGQTIKAFGTEYTVVGQPVGAKFTGNALSLAGGFFGNLIIQIAALCILWFAVMAALKQSKITEMAAEPITKFGNSIGTIAKSMPMYAPIIPTGKGGKIGIGNLEGISSGMLQGIKGSGSQAATTMGGTLAEYAGFKPDKITSEITKILATSAHKQAHHYNVAQQFDNAMAATQVKTVEEFQRLPKHAKDMISGMVLEMEGTITKKEDREEIANLLKGNVGDIAKALSKLDVALNGHVGGDIRLDGTTKTSDAYLAAQQTNKAGNTGANPAPVKLTLDNATTTILNMDATNMERELTSADPVKRGIQADLKTKLSSPEHSGNRLKALLEAIGKTEANADQATKDKMQKVLNILFPDTTPRN